MVVISISWGIMKLIGFIGNYKMGTGVKLRCDGRDLLELWVSLILKGTIEK